ncbi:hypothetical protein [Breznakia pachnodae]|uniref:DUF4253 domain-containing protein n=1 Tax=Breznakia pachnodae TaxID=265178 RepID=A0ABU0E3U3_9FIRM|nr:hypothetical protein [Breznakia pachnodae]MDQ0361555.1 hypothetical protein [Breznakia pachnodae]
MGLDQKFVIVKDKRLFLYKEGEAVLYYDEQDNMNYPDSVADLFLRKVNCVQGYFEMKYDLQNCDYIRVSVEDIQYLLEESSYILDTKDFELAKERLPIQYGLFYGNYEYDENYLVDLEICKATMQQILETIESDDAILYWSWW